MSNKPNPGSDRPKFPQVDRDRLADDDITSFTPARRRPGRDDDESPQESDTDSVESSFSSPKDILIDTVRAGASQLPDLVADAADVGMDVVRGVAQVIAGATNPWESGSYDSGADNDGDDDGDGDSGDDKGGGSNDGGTAGGGDLEGDTISGGRWIPHASTEAPADVAFNPLPLDAPPSWGESDPAVSTASDDALSGVDPTAGDGDDFNF